MTSQMLLRPTNTALADNSTYALYASAVVLTLAMLAFGLDLARASRRRAVAQAPRRELVGAGVGGRSAVEETPTGEGVDALDAAGADTPDRRWADRGMALSWLGTLLLVAAVVLRGLSVHRPPLGNMYEFALVACMFTMLAFLGWSLRRGLRWLGLFVVAPVLLVEMLAALVLYTEATQLMPSLQSYWLSIHVSVATLAIGLFTVGAVLTVLHLLQLRREEAAAQGRPPKPGALDALPPARSLDEAAYTMHVIAYPLWVFTLIAGAIWAQKAWGHYWNWDPKEVWSFIIFVVYTAHLHARLTTGWTARRVAYLALAGFACILINYGVVNVFFVGQHSYSGM